MHNETTLPEHCSNQIARKNILTRVEQCQTCQNTQCLLHNFWFSILGRLRKCKTGKYLFHLQPSASALATISLAKRIISYKSALSARFDNTIIQVLLLKWGLPKKNNLVFTSKKKCFSQGTTVVPLLLAKYSQALKIWNTWG